MARRKKQPVGPVSDGNEHMVRWKRHRVNEWHYHPKVYNNANDAIAMATLANQDKYGQKAPYSIQVLKLTVEVEWSPDGEVQSAAVESAVPETGG